MTDEIEPAASDKPQPSESATKTDKTPPEVGNTRSTPGAKVQAHRKSSSAGAYIISTIAILLVAAIAYYGYMQHQSVQQQITQLQQSSRNYQSGINRIQQESMQQTEQLIQRVQAAETQMAKDMQGLTDQIVAMNEAFVDLSGQKQTTWLADQAYYLLKIANNRIMFMQDTDTAIFLLTEADSYLSQLDDPNLFATRKKVSEDRQVLNARPKLDTTGLAIRISAFQSTITDLPMIQIAKRQDAEQEVEQTTPQTWYEHLLYSLDKLADQVFTVRTHGTGYTPVISESDEQQLRFAIMMTIQTIQYAVLYHNDDLFQANLLQLKSRLNNYFDNEDASVQRMVLEIDELLKLKVGHESFAGLTSLPALSAYIQQRDSTQNADESKADEQEAQLIEEDTLTAVETKQP